MADKKGMYSLPDLPYGYGDLAPFVSEQLLKVHHDGHHKKYVDQANALLERFDKARADGPSMDMKCAAQSLAFNVGGHCLHSLFWKNMAPPSQGGGGKPGGRIGEEIDKEFGSFERFRKEFTDTADSVESSGWATVVWCTQTGRPLLVQVKDHDLYAIPGFRTLLVLDVWEHAYYPDYKNKKPDYTAGFWNVVNWAEVDRRLEGILNGPEKTERAEKTVEKVSSGAVPIR